MTLEEILKTTLESIPSLKGHVFPLVGLKNAKAPFVLYLLDSVDEELALDGATGLFEATLEVNCVAATYAGLVSLSTAVQTHLNRLGATTHGTIYIEKSVCRQTSPDLLETEVNLYRRVYTLKLDYQEVNENE